MQPSMKDTSNTPPEAVGVVHIVAVPFAPEQLSELAHCLGSSGLIAWMKKPDQTKWTSIKLIETVAAERDAIGRKHPGLPVALLGLSYGAFVASAVHERMPEEYRATAFCNMPDLTPGKRRLLLALLYWERFRLGSDVHSRILLKMKEAPVTIGLAIACLQSAQPALEASPSAKHFKNTPDLSPETRTYGQNPIQSVSALNQNMNQEIADWAREVMRDQVA
jgi:pimeloyl-ACP methyl ester carboxylesterase